MKLAVASQPINQRIAPIEQTKDKQAIAAKADMSGHVPAEIRVAVLRTAAPPMTGTDSISENRAAESLSMPSCLAIVIVTPLLEAPGISAATCAIPMKRACQPVNFDQS